MKITTLTFFTVLAITTVRANPIPGESPHRHFCYRPGEACSKARRALDSLSAIHKRVALAHASALAQSSEQEKHHFCYRPGEACSKLKRAASAAASAMLLDPLPEPHSEKTRHHFCYRPGEACSKARRDALALAEALPLALPLPQTAPASLVSRGQGEPGKKHHFCYRPGEACSKAKRDALAAAEAEAEAEAIAHALETHGSQSHKRGVDANITATAAARAQAQNYCDSLAGPCAAMKRFKSALVDAVSEEKGGEEDGKEEEYMKRRCYADGGECAVYQRAVEEVGAVVARF